MGAARSVVAVFFIREFLVPHLGTRLHKRNEVVVKYVTRSGFLVNRGGPSCNRRAPTVPASSRHWCAPNLSASLHVQRKRHLPLMTYITPLNRRRRQFATSEAGSRRARAV